MYRTPRKSRGARRTGLKTRRYREAKAACALLGSCGAPDYARRTGRPLPATRNEAHSRKQRTRALPQNRLPVPFRKRCARPELQDLRRFRLETGGDSAL
jgi:hypothetical protein